MQNRSQTATIGKRRRALPLVAALIAGAAAGTTGYLAGTDTFARDLGAGRGESSIA